MPTTVLALKIFLILLPGFLSVKVSERLTLHKEKTTLQYVIDGFAFSLFVAFLYLVVGSLFPNRLAALDAISLKEKDISFGGFDLLSFFTLVGLAIIVGGVHGFVAEKGWFKRLLFELKITRRTGRVNVWMDVFYDYTNSWLRVYLNDDVVIEGWCRHFSDSSASDKFELFLEEIRIFREQISDEDEFKQYKRQILLTNRDSIKMIEFLEKMEKQNG